METIPPASRKNQIHFKGHNAHANSTHIYQFIVFAYWRSNQMRAKKSLRTSDFQLINQTIISYFITIVQTHYDLNVTSKKHTHTHTCTHVEHKSARLNMHARASNRAHTQGRTTTDRHFCMRLAKKQTISGFYPCQNGQFP